MTDHICSSGCTHDLHEVKEEFQEARRSFLRNAMAVGGSSLSVGALGISMTPNAFAESARTGTGRASHYYIPASDKTVHWGFFSRSLAPLVEVESGDFVTIETLTHHANDDAERMVRGDPGAESVFH